MSTISCAYKGLSLFLFIFLLSMAVYADDFGRYESLTMDIQISSEFTVLPRSSDYILNDITMNLSFIPFDTPSQELISIASYPEAQLYDDHAIFIFKDQKVGSVPFQVSASVISSNRFGWVDAKVPFPIIDLPQELMPYTVPRQVINSDHPQIIHLGSELAEGEDDLFVVVYKLADWVRSNVEYQLTPETLEESKNASWVLQNRYGVCDEITTLFIALCRSVGIPARYVSGVAYTNYQGLNDWGSHAWAEVYFPGHGWVPFDVTYSQFGFTDPTHITLKHSYDSAEPTTSYNWRGKNVNVLSSALKINTSLVERGNLLSSSVDLSVAPLKSKVGFGSYNLIELAIENKRPYYIVTTVQLAGVRDIFVEEDLTQFVLLRPYEKKTVFWTVSLNSDLRRNLIYTIPVVVMTSLDEISESFFTAEYRSPVYSSSEIAQLKSSLSIEEKKTIDHDLLIECQEGLELLLADSPEISCTVKNSGNAMLNGLSVCLDIECFSLDLGISQRKDLTFPITLRSPGEYDLVLTAKNEHITKLARSKIVLFDLPKVTFYNVTYPLEIAYDQHFSIEVDLHKDSYAVPHNITLNLKRRDGSVLAQLYVPSLEISHMFRFNMKGSDLVRSSEDLAIEVVYSDDLGNIYSDEFELMISLTDLTIAQRVLMFFGRISVFFIGFIV